MNYKKIAYGGTETNLSFYIERLVAGKLYYYARTLQHRVEKVSLLNPFVPNALFLYPLKTSENRKVSFGALGRVHWEQMG